MEKGQLIQKNQELTLQLKEANEIIEAIKQGKIDAVFIPGKALSNVLVAATSDQTYRRFIENMSEGIVTLHPDRTILYSNFSFAAMVDKPLQKVIGANLLDFIPAEYVGLLKQVMNRYPRGNSKVELSISNSQSKRLHFIVSLNTLQLQDFEALNLVWTDVTAQKETEQQLMIANDSLTVAIAERARTEHDVVILNEKLKENISILNEANTELGAFAHIAAHDLQEPLRKIITYSDLVQHDNYNTIGPRGQGYLDKIQKSSLRMRHLITDILDYSQVSQSPISFLPVDLQLVITGIVSDLEIVIKETKAVITIQKNMPAIDAGSGQMRQLFQNLLSNSLKFIKAGTVPAISMTFNIVNGHELSIVHPIGDKVLNEKFAVFYIKDNGIGFSPEYADKVFTIFQRLSSNSSYEGTGIGLAICKKIAEKHHGFIIAASTPGEGALFTIALPFRQPKG